MRKLSFELVNHFAYNDSVIKQGQGLHLRLPDPKAFDFSIADKGDKEVC